MCVCVSKDSSEESRRRQEEENKACVSQTTHTSLCEADCLGAEGQGYPWDAAHEILLVLGRERVSCTVQVSWVGCHNQLETLC